MDHNANVQAALATHRHMFGLGDLLQEVKKPTINYPSTTPIDYDQEAELSDEDFRTMSPLQRREWCMMYESDYAYENSND